TVPEILRKVAAMALQHSHTRLLIVLDDRPVVFRIQLRRELGRAHQVTKHHGELPALGFGRSRWNLHAEGRWRSTTCLPYAVTVFPVALLGCEQVPCGFQSRTTLAAESCIGGIITLTTWAPMLEGTPTLVTKLHPVGILKPTT